MKYPDQQLAASAMRFYTLRVKQHYDASREDGKPQWEYLWVACRQAPTLVSERAAATKFYSLSEVAACISLIAMYRCEGYDLNIPLEDLELLHAWQNEAPVNLHEALQSLTGGDR